MDGLNAILDYWEQSGMCDDRWLAYALATTFHETDATIAPIEEYGKGARLRYGKRLKMDGKPYTDTPHIFYGRGFVQLTWYENYKKAGERLGIDLLHHPELALTLPVATKILFEGMKAGWFTGKRLKDYFNGGREKWYDARRIINGTDRAELIAGYARRFYAAILHS